MRDIGKEGRKLPEAKTVCLLEKHCERGLFTMKYHSLEQCEAFGWFGSKILFDAFSWEYLSNFIRKPDRKRLCVGQLYCKRCLVHCS